MKIIRPFRNKCTASEYAERVKRITGVQGVSLYSTGSGKIRAMVFGDYDPDAELEAFTGRA